jgi:hypothetical protein
MRAQQEDRHPGASRVNLSPFGLSARARILNRAQPGGAGASHKRNYWLIRVFSRPPPRLYGARIPDVLSDRHPGSSVLRGKRKMGSRRTYRPRSAVN